MEPGWFDRLSAAISQDPRSLRQLSAEAGLGENYVQQMLKNKKEPGFDRLMKLLGVMSPETAMFVLTGVAVTRDDLEFLRRLRSLDEDAQEDLNRLMTRMLPTSED